MAEQTLAERAVEIFRDRSLTPAQRTEGFIDNMRKDPDAWVTGDDPATGAQLIYLQTLSSALTGSDLADENSKQKARDIFDQVNEMRKTGTITMSKSDAAKLITEYREQLGLPARP